MRTKSSLYMWVANLFIWGGRMCVCVLFCFVFPSISTSNAESLSKTVQYRPYCVDLKSADRKLPSLTILHSFWNIKYRWHYWSQLNYSDCVECGASAAKNANNQTAHSASKYMRSPKGKVIACCCVPLCSHEILLLFPFLLPASSSSLLPKRQCYMCTCKYKLWTYLEVWSHTEPSRTEKGLSEGERGFQHETINIAC